MCALAPLFISNPTKRCERTTSRTVSGCSNRNNRSSVTVDGSVVVGFKLIRPRQTKKKERNLHRSKLVWLPASYTSLPRFLYVSGADG